MQLHYKPVNIAAVGRGVVELVYPVLGKENPQSAFLPIEQISLQIGSCNEIGAIGSPAIHETDDKFVGFPSDFNDNIASET
jgi:hypothetical protein